jgi:hypothetical protein
MCRFEDLSGCKGVGATNQRRNKRRKRVDRRTIEMLRLSRRLPVTGSPIHSKQKTKVSQVPQNPHDKLLPGEQISTRVREGNSDPAFDPRLTNEKYAAGEVRIVTEQARYPLPTINSLIDSGKYVLQPDFQRRRRWDNDRKSRLIESFIINVPIPPVFLYEFKFSQYEVMDGQQRLSTVYDFYLDRFELSGLSEWPELNKLRYSQLPDNIREGIDRRYLSSIILLQETAKNKKEALRLKQLVFERINSGGVKLEDQESRNALIDGPLNQLCLKLSRNTHLCRMWNIPEPSPEELESGEPNAEVLACELFRRMDDVELVLRFFAYRQFLSFERSYSLKEYHDFFLRTGNQFPSSVLSGYEHLFIETMGLTYEIFGKEAFYLRRRRALPSGGEVWNWRESPTKVIYDPMTYTLSGLLYHSSKLIAAKQEILGSIGEFYQENYSEFEGRYTNRANIANRNRLFSDFFSNFL